jgi:hypothetical protein
METSAKKGFNVEELFAQAGKLLYQSYTENKEIGNVKFFLLFNIII